MCVVVFGPVVLMIEVKNATGEWRKSRNRLFLWKPVLGTKPPSDADLDDSAERNFEGSLHFGAQRRKLSRASCQHGGWSRNSRSKSEGGRRLWLETGPDELGHESLDTVQRSLAFTAEVRVVESSAKKSEAPVASNLLSCQGFRRMDV